VSQGRSKHSRPSAPLCGARTTSGVCGLGRAPSLWRAGLAASGCARAQGPAKEKGTARDEALRPRGLRDLAGVPGKPELPPPRRTHLSALPGAGPGAARPGCRIITTRENSPNPRWPGPTPSGSDYGSPASRKGSASFE
jgi:hypothetical protein